MTSIDIPSAHAHSAENEPQARTTIEPLKPGAEMSLVLADVQPLEVRGEFSRVATFELGASSNDEGAAVEAIDPRNPHAVILDVWTAGDKVFALPRLMDEGEPEDISAKAWNLADWPTGLPVGRQRNDIWQEKTGQALPGEVSGRHFGIDAKDGILRFADIGSTNGTRMETAVSVVEVRQDDAAPYERALGAAAHSLAASPEVDNSIHTRLGGNSVASESAPVKERQSNDLETMDNQLRSMRNMADNWEATLGSQPTFTHSDQLYGVSASLAADIAAIHGLRETMKAEADSSVGRMLSEVESTAQLAQASASMTASNIDSQIYPSGAEAHADRRRVEDLLRQYRSNLSELRRLIKR